MPEAISGFGCKACCRRFAWRPQLAGKRVKCACGNVLSVPVGEKAAVSPPRQTSLASAASRPVATVQTPSDVPGALDLSALEEAAAAQVAESAYRCPACQNEMIPGAVLCPSCGFNLVTRQQAGAEGAQKTVASAPFLAPPPAAGPLAHSGPRARPAIDSSDKLKILLGIGGIVVVVAAVFAFRFLSSAAPKKPSLGDDAKVEQAIRDENGQELEEWLGDGSRRMVMGMSSDQALSTAQNLKRMGAVHVLAFGGAMSRTLAIELPTDPKQRHALFDWAGNWNQQLAEDPSQDVGQRYIWINMHI